MKLRFARRWITIDSVARLVFLFVFLGLLAFPVETQAKELDHGLSYGTVVSRPTEFFSPGIESCVASIQRGLALMTVSKKNFDETRDYLVSAMAANPEAATDHVLPPNVEAIVAPKKFENVDDLRDFETALEMMKSFKDGVRRSEGLAPTTERSIPDVDLDEAVLRHHFFIERPRAAYGPAYQCALGVATPPFRCGGQTEQDPARPQRSHAAVPHRRGQERRLRRRGTCFDSRVHVVGIRDHQHIPEIPTKAKNWGP
jgi:hypothetical protein